MTSRQDISAGLPRLSYLWVSAAQVRLNLARAGNEVSQGWVEEQLELRRKAGELRRRKLTMNETTFWVYRPLKGQSWK